MLSIEQIKEAIAYLATCCDGAVNQDGVGFNGADSNFGKSLYHQIKNGDKLSPIQLEIALKMLKKYQNTQLSHLTLPTLDKLKLDLGVIISQTRNDIREVDLVDYVVVVSFEYNTEIIENIRTIEPKGRFNPSTKNWEFPFSALNIVIEKCLSMGFKLTDNVLNYLEAKREEERIDCENSELKTNWCLDYLKKESSNWGIKPYEHQWEAVKFFMSQIDNRCIISDQMGLGKSLSALLCAKSLQAWYKQQKDEDIRILVISPVSLKFNWFKEAGMVATSIEVFSYGKPPLPLKFSNYIVIADEFHYCQNIKSKRTQKVLDLVLDNCCVGLIGLTGTPMKNGRPSNLYPLLKAIKHPITYDRRDYERRYCDAHATAFTRWDITGASNLEELNIEISNKLIRRTKEECLDLPPKIFTSVDCEANTTAENEYQESLIKLRQQYFDRVNAGDITNNGQAVVFLGYFRRLASIYKSYQTIQLVEELLEENQPVVVFTDFIESAEKIANHFGVEPLTGKTKQEIVIDGQKVYPRQQMVDNFQSGKTDVFVGTIKAGGVGITLTRSTYIIMNDRPWTTGDYDQATDRIHRIGQTGTCNIIDVYGKDIDYIMAAMLNVKRQNIDKVLKKNKINMARKDNSDFYEYVLKRLVK